MAQIGRQLAIVSLVLLGGYTAWYLFRPTIQPQLTDLVESSRIDGDVSLPWPEYGQAAVGAVGYGVLAQSPSDTEPVPMASLAKAMAALAVLDKMPLDEDGDGPIYDISYDDVELHDHYQALGGVTLKVHQGQELSQRQLLQASMIASSNNAIDTLVNWAFGSMKEYLIYANQKADDLNMTRTNIDDASGFSPDSTATAGDLVLLGEAVMREPALRDTVKMWQVDIPDSELLTSTNKYLDYQGNQVVGIKTGFTDEAGGTYLGAADYRKDGLRVTPIVVVLGATTHKLAQDDAMPLLTATKDTFISRQILSANTEIATYDDKSATTTEPLDALLWPNIAFSPSVDLWDSRSKRGNTLVGEVVVVPGDPRNKIPVRIE